MRSTPASVNRTSEFVRQTAFPIYDNAVTRQLDLRMSQRAQPFDNL